MVLLESEMVPLGSKMPDFSLPGVDSQTYTPASFADAKAVVVVFMCNHCPYVKATIERLVSIYDDYKAKGVAMIGINANDPKEYPDDDFAHMKKFAQEKKMDFPYVQDSSQAVARAYKAVCTPDIFVYDSEKNLAYRGRIDDNWKEPEKVTSQDLRVALDALVAGSKPSEVQHPSMGCSIKWK